MCRTAGAVLLLAVLLGAASACALLAAGVQDWREVPPPATHERAPGGEEQLVN